MNTINQTSNQTMTRAVYHGKDYRPLAVKATELTKTSLKVALVTGILASGFTLTGEQASASTSHANIHVVKSGDTLYGLSRTYGVSIQQLKNDNGLTSDTIYFEQALVIKDAKKTVPTIPTPTVQSVKKTVYSQPVNVSSYAVQAGDTLSSIARSYNTTVSDVKKWNNLNSDKIMTGQRLTLHSPKTSSVSNEQTDKKIQNGVYIVQPGDSLWRISRTYNVSVEHLLKMNNLKHADLRPGQTLQVSAPISVPTQKPTSVKAPASSASVHVVQVGDTLTKIAKKANTSLDTLIHLNGLSLDSTLAIGQQIKLPTTAVKTAIGTITGVVDSNSIEVYFTYLGFRVLAIQKGTADYYASKEGQTFQITFSVGSETERPSLISLQK